MGIGVLRGKMTHYCLLHNIQVHASIYIFVWDGAGNTTRGGLSWIDCMASQEEKACGNTIDDEDNAIVVSVESSLR